MSADQAQRTQPAEMSGDGTRCTPAGRVRRDEDAWGLMQSNCFQATDLDVRSQVAAGIRCDSDVRKAVAGAGG
jgi:hypothetical protein